MASPSEVVLQVLQAIGRFIRRQGQEWYGLVKPVVPWVIGAFLLVAVLFLVHGEGISHSLWSGIGAALIVYFFWLSILGGWKRIFRD
jgi:uncharacterized phage infection (PIP) family protein YhgE